LSKARKENNSERISYLKLAVVGLLAAFLAFAASDRLDSQLSDVIIEIEKSQSKKYLLNEKDVKLKLKQILGYDISLANLGQIDLYDLERKLTSDQRINKSDLFIDKHNRLYVKVEQRQPIVRIQVSGGKDYYLDYNGERIPVTEAFRVPVVTGNVGAYVANYKDKKNSGLNQVWQLSQRIYDNDFLRVLVEQIDVDNKGEMTIVPKFPQSKIVLGDGLDLDGKLKRIGDYYKHLKKHGHDPEKDEVDVKYEGHIARRESQS
jgi:cell division protein FtsQ